MIENGAASNAPTGPEIQVQNASASKIRSGLSVRRRPMIVGVMKCPSIVVRQMKASGTINA